MYNHEYKCINILMCLTYAVTFSVIYPTYMFNMFIYKWAFQVIQW